MVGKRKRSLGSDGFGSVIELLRTEADEVRAFLTKDPMLRNLRRGLERLENEKAFTEINGSGENGVCEVAESKLNAVLILEYAELESLASLECLALAAQTLTGEHVEVTELFVLQGNGSAEIAVGFNVVTKRFWF